MNVEIKTQLEQLKQDTKRTFELLDQFIESGDFKTLVETLGSQAAHKCEKAGIPIYMASTVFEFQLPFCKTVVEWLLLNNDGKFPTSQLHILDKMLREYGLLPPHFINFSVHIVMLEIEGRCKLDYNKGYPMIIHSIQDEYQKETYNGSLLS